MTIFTSAPAALIPQPGRAVNTFPSGLVRVDQTYLGLTSQSATHRAILAVGNDMPDGDTSPCIDGLKIFPEAQERRREDGFTEYIVSAYGRVNTAGKNTPGLQLARLEIDTFYYTGNRAGFDVGYGGQGKGLYTYDILLKPITKEIVLKNNEIDNTNSIIESPTGNGFSAIKVVTVNTDHPETITLTPSLSSIWTLKNSNFSNFGIFNECKIFFEPTLSGTIEYKAK